MTYEGWTLFSKRGNSTNYFNADETRMLKVMPQYSDGALEAARKEKEISNKVAAMGLPTPRIFDIVTMEDGLSGIIYEYIKDKQSFSRAISNDFGNLEMYAKRFAVIANKLHSTECNTDAFPSIEDRIRSCLEAYPFTEEQRGFAESVMRNTPKTNTCLLTDFHIGNFLTSPSGDYIIDLGLFSYGNPLYDLGLLHFFCHEIPEEVMNMMFHLTPQQTKETFDAILSAYYGVTDREKLEELKEKIAPYGPVTFIGHMSQLQWDEISPMLQSKLDKYSTKPANRMQVFFENFFHLYFTTTKRPGKVPGLA